MDIFQAIKINNIEMVRTIIIEPSFDPNIMDDDGNTPLFLSSWYGHRDCFNLLYKDFRVDRNLWFDQFKLRRYNSILDFKKESKKIC